MIKEFDTLKTQLEDLARIVQMYPSEATQLRVIDLVLGSAMSVPLVSAFNDLESGEDEEEYDPPKRRPGRPKGKTKGGKRRY